MRRFLWLSFGALLLAGIVVASSGGATQAEARWVITNLGTLPGGGRSGALAINDRGQIVGWSETKNSLRHAFIWQGGRMRDLGTLEARDINNRGQVVGVAGSHGFLWQNGKMRDLGTLGGSRSEAVAVNDRGQVVGWADTKPKAKDGDTIQHAFLWEDGKMRDLGTFRGVSSTALAINERGQIVGWWNEEGTKKTGYLPSERAFLWENGRMRDLGALSKILGGVSVTEPTGINERCQVVGWSHTTRVRRHPFLWQNGKMRDLGVLAKSMDEAEANAINGSGQIVGTSYFENEKGDRWFERAFIWQNGRMSGLPPLPRDKLSGAADVNGRGQVVGSSTPDTYAYTAHAVLWTLKR